MTGLYVLLATGVITGLLIWILAEFAPEVDETP